MFMRTLKRIDPRTLQALFAAVVLIAMSAVLLSSKSEDFWWPIFHSVNPLRSEAGFKRAMPKDAFDSVMMLRKQKLGQFMLGPGIWKRPMILQRTVEGAYPIRGKLKSKNIVDYADRIDLERCRVVARRGRMALAICGG